MHIKCIKDIYTDKKDLKIRHHLQVAGGKADQRIAGSDTAPEGPAPDGALRRGNLRRG